MNGVVTNISEAAKRKFKKSSKSEEELFKEKLDKYIEKLLIKFREEMQIPDEYNIIAEDAFFSFYFNLVNKNIQMIFQSTEDAITTGQILMKSSLAMDISYFKIEQIVIKEGFTYILEPVYNNKKELTSLNDNIDLLVKVEESKFINTIKNRVSNGTIIIDDLFLK